MKLPYNSRARLVCLPLLFFLLLTPLWAEGDGYGENPGGGGGDTVVVDNSRDLKKYASATQPYVILIKDTIDVGSEVRLSSYKTLSGMGPNSTLIGNVTISGGVNNVVVKNLNITNPANDGITIRNAQYVYVNNCTVFDCGDGCIDVTVESDFVTISNCRFYYEAITFHKFVNLIGASDDNITDRGKLHVTFHGNWWDTGCTSRMPRVRFGYVHIYNNYYSCSGNNYCNRAGLEGHILSEYNYFEGVRDPLTTEEGWAKSVGNTYDNCEGTIHPGTDEMFTPSYYYNTTGTDIAKAQAMQHAGNTKNDPNPPQAKKTTRIQWQNQGTIVLGTPLDASHLNATAEGNTSTPVYSHPIGTVLPEGYQTLTVTFPEDDQYLEASKTVNIRVKYDYYTLTLHTVNASGEHLITPNPEGTWINNKRSYPIDTEVEITANNNLVSVFEHWQDGVQTSTRTLTITDDTELTAIYAPITYIAAWDLLDMASGNKDRRADYYQTDENKLSTLSLQSAGGSINWTVFSDENPLEGKVAAMIRRGSSQVGEYYFQLEVDAANYQNIRVEAYMLGMLTYYQVQQVEYSTDQGQTFKKVGAYTLQEASTWYPGAFALPADANGVSRLLIRFKADTNSPLISGGLIGTSISEIRVLADVAVGTPATLETSAKNLVNTRYFTLGGRELPAPSAGITIVLFEWEDGTHSTQKIKR